MAKEWTDEEVQNEIREAIRIVREDRFETFVRGRIAPPSNDQNGNGNPPTNNPPPPNGAPGSEPKKKSLFWGVEQ